MNLVEFLFYYFVFIFATVYLLKSVVKKEDYQNILDYRVDLILHELRKEIGDKLKEGFNSSNTESVGKYFKEKEQKIIYTKDIDNFKSPDIPQYISIKPTIKANYVYPYTDLNPYIEDFFNPRLHT